MTTSPAASASHSCRSMLERGHLTGGDGTLQPRPAQHDKRVGYGHHVDYALTPAGEQFLADFGFRLLPRRSVIRYCID